MYSAYHSYSGRPCSCPIGVHTGFQDSTPMVLFIGDVRRDFRDREAFQEVDFTMMFRPLAKWVERIDDIASTC